jgi:mannose-6-phosphate isomerase
MLILKRIIHNTIWGGSKISQYTGVEGDSIGHLYSLYCRKGVSNEILNGKWKGQCLNNIFPLFKEDFHLSHYEYFPLTLALTEAHENLSIQVHPNDKMANELEHNARGKRESWYFIEAPLSGIIINGCTCLDEEEEQLMIQRGQFMEMADTLSVKKGDYVYVEPGTLHAITAGSLVYEIEEGSDYTYRFYDYDRVDAQGNKRELHVAKATSSLNIRLKSVVKTYKQEEIKEMTYSTKLIKGIEQYINKSNTLECFTTVIGTLNAEGMQVPPGSTIILWPGEELNTHQIELSFVSKMLEG